MIRDYEKGDEALLNFNRFSDPSAAPEVFESDEYVKKTLTDEGVIRVIVCWREIAPASLASFILMSKDISTRYFRELKRFIKNVIVSLGLRLVLTYSVDCEEINRWHRFLGFELDVEGKVTLGDKSFNKWVMRWA